MYPQRTIASTCFRQLFSTSKVPICSSTDQKLSTVILRIQYLQHKIVDIKQCIVKVVNKLAG